MSAIRDPIRSFNIMLFVVVNDPGEPLHPVQEDSLDVFKSEVIPDICQDADQCLNPVYLAIL
jgi:hypothetical protein